MKYCGKADFKSIGANVEQLNIDAYYSDMVFHFAEDANLTADITTSYSNIKKLASFKGFDLTVVSQGNMGNSGHYKLKVGKGDGSANINGHYSNINFK